MHESNRPAACVWLLLLMTPESGWGWGILGMTPYAILTFRGHGPHVNNSFVGYRPW